MDEVGLSLCHEDPHIEKKIKKINEKKILESLLVKKLRAYTLFKWDTDKKISWL